VEYFEADNNEDECISCLRQRRKEEVIFCIYVYIYIYYFNLKLSHNFEFHAECDHQVMVLPDDRTQSETQSCDSILG
jgi:hypothetical protein